MSRKGGERTYPPATALVLRRPEGASKDAPAGAAARAKKPAMMGGASIYILRCADGGYYTGITRRAVEERVSEHAAGVIPSCFTFSRRPVDLAYSEPCE